MANKSFKTLLLQYIVNHRQSLQEEQDYNFHLLKYRRIDPVDLLEYQISLIRLQAFDEFSRDILALLDISNGGSKK